MRYMSVLIFEAVVGKREHVWCVVASETLSPGDGNLFESPVSLRVSFSPCLDRYMFATFLTSVVAVVLVT